MNKLCKTRADVANVAAQIEDLRQRGKPVMVKWEERDPRSVDQNSLSHEWYAILAMFLTEDDCKGWRRYCKLHFGVPILRAESEDFRHQYDAIVKPHQYEKKLAFMDFLPVTSLFTKQQFSSYLDAVAQFGAERGVILRVE